MAQIDVSPLMTDPDFVGPFTLIRRATLVNNYGENVLTETLINNVIGSVQSANADTFLRLPEAARSQNFITIYTKVQMRTDESGSYADAVIWKGRRYTVKKVTPWDNFGAGWYMADCEMETASNA